MWASPDQLAGGQSFPRRSSPFTYYNVPKLLDRQVCANSVDLDLTAPGAAVWSGLHCLPFHLYYLDTLLYGTNFQTVATFHFQCKFCNFSFCLNQPHQRKWKYFHPLGIFSFKRFVICQFTYWRPALYLNDPFRITKQLCHWQLRHYITSCQIWLFTYFLWVQTRPVHTTWVVGCWRLFEIYSNMISKDSRFFWSERWRVSIL